MEHFGEGAERLYEQLQHVVGRVEKIYTPVQEHEITHVIRHRLFSHVNKGRAREVVADFTDYAEKESILPPEPNHPSTEIGLKPPIHFNLKPLTCCISGGVVTRIFSARGECCDSCHS